jgi:hypothetical protein
MSEPKLSSAKTGGKVPRKRKPSKPKPPNPAQLRRRTEYQVEKMAGVSRWRDVHTEFPHGASLD